MTSPPRAHPQPAVPIQHAPLREEGPSANSLLSERGYSDSVLPSCRLSADKQHQILMDEAAKVTPSTALTSTLASAQGDIARSKVIPLSNRMKAKADLRLPSFQTLGIASLHLKALLTPPDESTLPDLPTAPTSNLNHPRRLSFPQAALPRTPDLIDLDSTPITTSKGTALKQSTNMSAGSPEIATPRGGASTTSVAVEEAKFGGGGGGHPEWLSEAIDVTTNEKTPPTAAAAVTAGCNVVSVLCHTQPCPLQSEGSSTTAFNHLMSTLQERVDPATYIEVTHAVPLRFSMGQVPNSPAVTPSPHDTQPSTDYFSMHTFSKAVVAADYQQALENSVPSSPHPLVAPSTINIALLERYFPPTSANESLDLFSTDAPSALVDRLTELSPNKGTLLFIYPTATGAATFAHQYLSPLLDPLLRTMAGVHGLASDLGANTATMTAIDSMLSFDGMTRKLNQLLRRLGRHPSLPVSGRPPPKFEIVYSSAKTVILDRKSWTEWWIHQEKDRIQGILKRYFQRGYKLPTKDTATSGALCREILDGIRSRGEDADSTIEGVELGVFVIQRFS
ncbi:MAG: hypothetical protein Q9163_006415 [Psora crenata]